MNSGLIVLSSIAIMNMLSLAVILILKKPNCAKNRLLSIILLIPAYSIILNLIRYLSLFNDYSFFIAVEYILLYSWAPLIFFYVKIMTGEHIPFSLKTFLHFLPGLVVIISMTVLLILSEGHNLLNHVLGKDSFSLTQLFEMPYALQAFIYLFYCRFFLKKYNDSAHKSIAKIHPVSLHWLQNFVFTLILIIFLICVAIVVFPVVEYFLLFSSIACIIPYLYLFYKLFSSEHLFSEKEQELLSKIILEKKREIQAHLEEKIRVKVDKTLISLDINDIFFIKSEEKYTRIYLKDKSYLSDYTLSELEKKYPRHLLRIHRNTLVNKHLVQGIEKFKGGKLHVLMEDGNSLEVSRRMMEVIKGMFA